MRKGTRLSPSLTIVVVVRGESLGMRLAEAIAHRFMAQGYSPCRVRKIIHFDS